MALIQTSFAVPLRCGADRLRCSAVWLRWGSARQGDWVRRMRFWRAITRGARAVVCWFQGTHALPSKARSP